MYIKSSLTMAWCRYLGIIHRGVPHGETAVETCGWFGSLVLHFWAMTMDFMVCVSSFGVFSKKAQEWDGWRFTTKSNLWLTEPWFWPIAILHHPFNANLLLGLNKTLPYVYIYIYIKRFNATRTSKEGLRFPESVVKTSHGSGELLISSLNSTFMSQAESKINQSLFGLEMEKLRHAQDD